MATQSRNKLLNLRSLTILLAALVVGGVGGVLTYLAAASAYTAVLAGLTATGGSAVALNDLVAEEDRGPSR